VSSLLAFTKAAQIRGVLFRRSNIMYYFLQNSQLGYILGKFLGNIFFTNSSGHPGQTRSKLPKEEISSLHQWLDGQVTTTT
jgi:hypothetical protein